MLLALHTSALFGQNIPDSLLKIDPVKHSMQVSGKIRDEYAACAFLKVGLYNGDELIAICMSDIDGHYRFHINGAYEGKTLTLVFRSAGYEEHRVNFTFKMYRINFIDVKMTSSFTYSNCNVYTQEPLLYDFVPDDPHAFDITTIGPDDL